MAERKDLHFILNDGTEIETSFGPPYTVLEQLAFEDAFDCSFVVIDKARAALQEAAIKTCWTVRCAVCDQGGYAFTEDQAESMKAKHREEKGAEHIVDITEPEDPDSEIDPTKAYRLKHMLWIGWFRARPKVASKFPVFRDEQLKDYRFVTPEPEPEPADEADEVAPLEDPPEVAPPEEEPAVAPDGDGSLDPTGDGPAES